MFTAPALARHFLACTVLVANYMNAGDSRGRACGHACPLLDCQPDLCRCL